MMMNSSVVVGPICARAKQREPERGQRLELLLLLRGEEEEGEEESEKNEWPKCSKPNVQKPDK